MQRMTQVVAAVRALVTPRADPVPSICHCAECDVSQRSLRLGDHPSQAILESSARGRNPGTAVLAYGATLLLCLALWLMAGYMIWRIFQ